MKKNTKWLLENKTNYEKIFEDKREKKLDLNKDNNQDFVFFD